MEGVMPDLFMPDGRPAKYMPCRDCNEPILVGKKTRNKPRHLLCAIKVAVAAQSQLHEKSGPYYEKWKAGMRNFANRELRATPLPPEN